MVKFFKSGIDIKIGKSGFTNSYLLLVDDCIIFYKENKSAARNVKVIVKNYCNLSGQLVNFYKAMVQFSRELKKKTKAWYYEYFPGIYIEQCFELILVAGILLAKKQEHICDY